MRSALAAVLVLGVLASPAHASDDEHVRTQSGPDWMAEDERALQSELFHRAEEATAPFYVRLPEGRDALVLTAAPKPYTLDRLARDWPQVVEQRGEVAIVKHRIVVGPGATLMVTPPPTRTIRLMSDAKGYAAIIGVHGVIEMSDVRIESWAGKGPDKLLADGRAYVSAAGGKMTVKGVTFSRLGFQEGTVSGAAWRGTKMSGQHTPGRGTVTDSTFTNNWFGAYTFEAVGMTWKNNRFVRNLGYGFDPHDYTDKTTFVGNKAWQNGSHGIIFSRGCDDNVIRNNEAWENHGHGIMIDDGKVVPGTSNPRWEKPIPSSRNVIEGNRVWDNLDGIVIEGGDGNVVRNNVLTGTHRWGLRITDQATHTLATDNSMETTTRAAIHLAENSRGNHVARNTVDLAAVGIELNDVRRNILVDNTFRKLRLHAVVADRQSADSNQILGNSFAGNGTAIEDETTERQLKSVNDFSGWLGATPELLIKLGIAFWAVLLLIPLVSRILLRRRTRRAPIGEPR